MSLSNQLSKVLRRHFGDQIYGEQITNVIGYGSGVFKQLDFDPNSHKYQTDVIIMVKNLKAFHRLNFDKNINDYSGISYILGAQYLSFLNRVVFPWHSNHIKTESHQIKYSAVQEETVIKDIKQWNYISFAGRLQKPVLPIQQYSKNIVPFITQNYQTALYMALLLMTSQRTEKVPGNDQIPLTKIPFDKLFTLIAEISYMGDLRKNLGLENKQKTANIVLGNLVMFKSVYIPLLHILQKSQPNHIKSITNDYVLIKYTASLIPTLIRYLPLSLYRQIHEQSSRQFGKDKSIQDTIMLMGIKQAVLMMQNKIKKTNRNSSFWMGLQNALGSSPFGNVNYIIRKVDKKNKK